MTKYPYGHVSKEQLETHELCDPASPSSSEQQAYLSRRPLIKKYVGLVHAKSCNRNFQIYKLYHVDSVLIPTSLHYFPPISCARLSAFYTSSCTLITKCARSPITYSRASLHIVCLFDSLGVNLHIVCTVCWSNKCHNLNIRGQKRADLAVISSHKISIYTIVSSPARVSKDAVIPN